MNKSIKIFLNWFLAPALLIWLGISLYHQVSRQPDLAHSWQRIKNSFSNSEAWKIYTACLLMLVNWGVEALKWQLLVSPVQKVSYFTAVKAVLAGTTLSATTPNRVGEYIGRMVYMDEGNRLRSIPVTVVGSFSQLIITVVAGCAGLFFFVYNPAVLKSWDGNTIFWIKICLGVVTAGTAVMLLVYFKLSLLITALERIPFIQKYSYFLKAAENLEAGLLAKTLLLSLCRYVVFLVQYILVMDAFGVWPGLGMHICLLTVMFLVLAIIPTFVLAEVGVRGRVSTFLYGVVSSDATAVFSAGFFIWLLNLVIPAVAGGLLLTGKRIFKKLQE